MGSLPREIKKVIKADIILVLITLLVINPFGSTFVVSFTNQEFFSYHIRDIIEYMDKDTSNHAGYYLATGTYEGETDGSLFGIAEGKNLIIVQVEALQNMVINAEYEGQELTPSLNELIKAPGTIYFDNYYQQVGSGNTSDAEFASNNSMLGSIESYTYQLFEDNYFKGLPWLLKDKGYETAVFHGYKKEFWNRENIYPALGFDTFYGDTEFTNDHIAGIGGGNIVGISDHAFFKQSVEYLKEMSQPYYSFLITLSSHNPFNLPKKLMEIDLLPQDQNIVGNYFNSVYYADKCIGEFIDALKEEGLYDDSIIVFYGDHFGLSKSDTKIDALVSDWLGYEYTYDNMLNIPLIIHIPGTEVNEKVSIAGGQIDLMPTLAYLMGFETLDTIYLGRNLLTTKSGLVPIQTHMIKGSFIKDEVVLEMSRDGIFENSKAWNRYTGEEITDTSPYFKDYVKAKEMVELNTFYLYNDILRRVYVENKDMDAILRQLDGDDQPQTKMQLFYLKSTDEVGLGDFVAYMKQHVDKKVLLSSDDLHALLTHFENTFSGVSGEPGAIKSVDQAVNADYLQIKSRIIPLLDGVTGYTKLEYLGYTDIMVRLKIMDYTSEQIREFIMVNDPYAIAFDYTDLKSQSNRLLRGETPVFLYGERTEWQEALAKAMGAYGCVDSLMPIN